MINRLKCLFGGHSFDFVQTVGRFTPKSVKHYTLFVCAKCDKLTVEAKDITASYDLMSDTFSRFLRSSNEDRKNKLKLILGSNFIDTQPGVDFYKNVLNPEEKDV